MAAGTGTRKSLFWPGSPIVPAITSRHHTVVKMFRTVIRGDATRAVLDGWHLLREAVVSGLDLEVVAVGGKIADDGDRALVDELAARRDVRVVSVSTPVMNAISPVRAPTGVVAIVRRRSAHLKHLLAPVPALVIVAIDIQDPGNAGAIVRAAEAGGATGVVFAGDSADAWSWKALRAAMGSTFRIPLWRDRDPLAVCQKLRSDDIALVATVARGGVTMGAADLQRPTALLVGAEGSGLAPEVLAAADSRLTIPMQPQVESLNVAVACGVLVYEARRQRMNGGSRRRFST